MPKPRAKETEVQILELERGQIQVAAVGTTPFICNRVSEKAKRELLAPKGRKTSAEKAQNLKHVPLEEYRLSPYTIPDDTAPTLLAFLAAGFKRAMMTAALDIPGAKKAQIGRLVRVAGERIPLYGLPKLLMSVTRSADMNRTPDIRTRAIVPQWAVLLEVTFAKPMLREKSVLNLLAAAGVVSGVGDWRVEKGSGDYGAFRLASANDPELQQILATGGRTAQQQALNNPVCYDDETESLLSWWNSEMAERGFKVAV